MKLDDDGRQYAVTLDDAQATLLGLLTRAVGNPETGDEPWISYAVDYGKDRGERVLLTEITHPSGVCEGFRLALTRDII